eukprot:4382191-Amphidinium_carterae.1
MFSKAGVFPLSSLSLEFFESRRTTSKVESGPAVGELSLVQPSESDGTLSIEPVSMELADARSIGLAWLLATRPPPPPPPPLPLQGAGAATPVLPIACRCPNLSTTLPLPALSA